MLMKELKILFKDLEELNNIKLNFLNASNSLNEKVNKNFDEKTEILHVIQDEMLKKVDLYRLNRIEMIDIKFFTALDKWFHKVKRDYSNLCKTDEPPSEEILLKKFELIESKIQNMLNQIEKEIFGKEKLVYQLSYFNMNNTGERTYNCLNCDYKYSCSIEAKHLTLLELELNTNDTKGIIVSNVLINDGHTDRILIYYILNQSNAVENSLNKSIYTIDGIFVDNLKIFLTHDSNEVVEILFIRDSILTNINIDENSYVLYKYDDSLALKRHISIKQKISGVKTDQDKIFIFFKNSLLVHVYSENLEKIFSFGQNVSADSPFYLDLTESCRVGVKNEFIFVCDENNDNELKTYNYLTDKIEKRGFLRKKYDFFAPINSSLVLCADYKSNELCFYNSDLTIINSIQLKNSFSSLGVSLNSNIFIYNFDFKITVFSSSHLI